MRTPVVRSIAGLVTLVAACRTPTRGEPCKTDDDCKKANLECKSLGIGGNSFCTTTCSIAVPDSCPSGWKCIDVSRFTDLHDYACVRN